MGRFGGRSITAVTHSTPYAPRRYDYDRPPVSSLTKARERAKISLADLAARIGVAAQVLTQIENRTRRATEAQVEAIDRILGADWHLNEPPAQRSQTGGILLARKRLLKMIRARAGGT